MSHRFANGDPVTKVLVSIDRFRKGPGFITIHVEVKPLAATDRSLNMDSLADYVDSLVPDLAGELADARTQAAIKELVLAGGGTRIRFKPIGILARLGQWAFLPLGLIITATMIYILYEVTAARRRRLPGHCPECGYEYGFETSLCPECGAERAGRT